MFPGVSTLNQIERVLKVTGMPSQEDVYDLGSNASKIFATIPPTKKASLESVFSTAPEDAIDLMNKLLKFNPAERLTVEEALEHAYVSQFHNIDNEPICKKKINISIDDNKKFSIKEYRLKIYTDIHRRKKKLKEKILNQKKKSAVAYATQYNSGYHKKEVAKEEEPQPRPSSKSRSSYKRHGTAKYTSATTAAAAAPPKTAADKEKYRKYYHAKTYKM